MMPFHRQSAVSVRLEPQFLLFFMYTNFAVGAHFCVSDVRGAFVRETNRFMCWDKERLIGSGVSVIFPSPGCVHWKRHASVAVANNYTWTLSCLSFQLPPVASLLLLPLFSIRRFFLPPMHTQNETKELIVSLSICRCLSHSPRSRSRMEGAKRFKLPSMRLLKSHS